MHSIRFTPAQAKQLEEHFKAWEHVLKFDTSKIPVSGSIFPCLKCARLFQVPVYLGVVDLLCGECSRDYRECATILCRSCGVAVCKVTPKLLSNGFYIRKNMVLHIASCGVCKPNEAKDYYTSVEEIALWQRDRGGNIRTIFLPGAPRQQ